MSPSSKLGAASHLILGLLALEGPRTSYELNDVIDESVGNFWNIPRSQLYAAPRRLAELGLVTEEQEETGRRRRTFTITEEGQQAVRDWIESPSTMPELRDSALLRLFFADLVDPAAMQRLAADQTELHQRRLDHYLELTEAGRTEEFWGASLVLRMGVHHERAHVAFWTELGERLEAEAAGEQPAEPTGTPPTGAENER
ncbi:MAG: PadR family transcriptional regulator [Microbacteriaceae bacterium]|nr:PadR family transcriptional regulator [Microbacteriaceae bacterium]